MDQIYREYSEKYKHILHYAGIMKKEENIENEGGNDYGTDISSQGR